MIKLNVYQIIHTPSAVSDTTATTLKQTIIQRATAYLAAHINQPVEVMLDFSGVTYITVSFLSYALGEIYKDYNNRIILSFQGLKSEDIKLVELVKKSNSESYNPYEYNSDIDTNEIKLTSSLRNKIENFLSSPCYEFANKGDVWRDWFKKVLVKLNTEGEGFSSKRVTGNYDWHWNLAIALGEYIEPKIIKKVYIDESGETEIEKINWVLQKKVFNLIVDHLIV